MQKAARERVIPIRFGQGEIATIDALLEKTGTRSRSEFIREAVRHYIDTVAETKVIKLRKVKKEQAKKEILGFIKGRKEADTFDIANELRLDMDTTIEALRELWEEGEVK